MNGIELHCGLMLEVAMWQTCDRLRCSRQKIKRLEGDLTFLN